MLKDKNYDKAQNVRLPRQDTLPSQEQLREMYSGAIKNPGRTSELPFGDAFVISVLRRPGTGACTWTLIRWAGTTSTPEWEYDSNDPRWVHQQITEYFPRWSPHRRALRDPSDTEDSWSPMVDAAEAPSSRRAATMEGEIKYVGVPRLLRTIAKDKLTGQLEIDGENDNAVIFFGEGLPMHSVTSKYDGEQAIVDLINWKNGHFEFHTTDLVNKKTIHKNLDMLLSIALSPDPRPAEQGIPGGLLGQEASHSKGSHSSPYDARSASGSIILPTDLDKLGIHSLLTNTQTGCFTEGAINFLLELEFERCYRYSRNFSFITVFGGLKPQSVDETPEPLPLHVTGEIGRLITKCKRKSDILGHYGVSRLAMILVETDKTLALNLSTRLAEILLANGAPELNEGRQIVFTIGVASAPTDATDLETLINLATTRTRNFGW